MTLDLERNRLRFKSWLSMRYSNTTPDGRWTWTRIRTKARKMEKRVWAATHPYLTAVWMGNKSVSEALQRTVSVIPSWSSLGTVMNCGGQPYLAGIFNRIHGLCQINKGHENLLVLLSTLLLNPSCCKDHIKITTGWSKTTLGLRKNILNFWIRPCTVDS